jgi:hypothetical protein
MGGGKRLPSVNNEFQNPDSNGSKNHFKLARGTADYFKGIVNPQMRVVESGTNRTVMTSQTIADVF